MESMTKCGAPASARTFFYAVSRNNGLNPHPPHTLSCSPSRRAPPGGRLRQTRAAGCQWLRVTASVARLKATASAAFAKQIKAFAMRPSMSRKGDCWDNAVAESLFGSLKTESLHRHDFGTRRAASDEIMAWITSYNHSRLHSTLGYLSPRAYEKKWLATNQAEAA